MPIARHCKTHNFVAVSRLHDFKLECNVKRNAVIGSYNIQGGQSQRGCVASASKIPSEYTSVASTKNDNALTWPYNLKWRIHASFSFTFGMCFLLTLNRTGSVHFIYWAVVYAVISVKLFRINKTGFFMKDRKIAGRFLLEVIIVNWWKLWSVQERSGSNRNVWKAVSGGKQTFNVDSC